MTIEIRGEKRDTRGKNAARKLRREGKVPAVLYGAKMESVALSLSKKDLIQILKSETGENTLFKVSFESMTMDSMVKLVHINPVTDELLHADLIKITMDKVIKVSVPVVLTGEAIGVKTEGGFVDFVCREIEIECLPNDIPENIKVDISELHLHQGLKIEDIENIEKLKVINDLGQLVVLIDMSKKEEEVVEEEEGEEAVLEEDAEAKEADGKEEKE